MPYNCELKLILKASSNLGQQGGTCQTGVSLFFVDYCYVYITVAGYGYALQPCLASVLVCCSCSARQPSLSSLQSSRLTLIFHLVLSLVMLSLTIVLLSSHVLSLYPFSCFSVALSLQAPMKEEQIR